jgi:hypothetical protein
MYDAEVHSFVQLKLVLHRPGENFRAAGAEDTRMCRKLQQIVESLFSDNEKVQDPIMSRLQY